MDLLGYAGLEGAALLVLAERVGIAGRWSDD